MPRDARTPSSWLGRGLLRLGRAVCPDSEKARDQLSTLGVELRAWRQSEVRSTAEIAARLGRAESYLEALGHDAKASRRDLGRIRAQAIKQGEHVWRVARAAGVDQRTIEAERRVEKRLATLARRRAPIVVGPWTGEVGFELLYWIPFLQWAQHAFQFDPERLIVLSRGGVRSWYGHVSPHYEDVFRLVTPEQVRVATHARKKQQRLGELDRDLVKKVMRQRGLTRVHLLHPSLMYELYKPFWRYDESVAWLTRFSRFKALCADTEADASGLPDLPRDFVAVRFYFSECFPDNPENRAFAIRVVRTLAARTHVVLLNNDVVIDDHRDFTPGEGALVHRIATAMRPETNLAVQTAVIRRARAFVGTYGGYSYLAPLAGVPSVAFHSRPAFKRHHLELAQRELASVAGAWILPLSVEQAATWIDMLGGGASSP